MMGAAVQMRQSNSVRAEQRVWDRQPGESPFWYARLWHYIGQGPNRELLATAQAFREKPGKFNGTPIAYARESKKRQWKERAAAYDEWQFELDELLNRAERDELLKNGHADKYKRVATLSETAHILVDNISEVHKKGQVADVVELVKQLRGTFADIKGELEGRGKTKSTVLENKSSDKISVELSLEEIEGLDVEDLSGER